MPAAEKHQVEIMFGRTSKHVRPKVEIMFGRTSKHVRPNMPFCKTIEFLKIWHVRPNFEPCSAELQTMFGRRSKSCSAELRTMFGRTSNHVRPKVEIMFGRTLFLPCRTWSFFMPNIFSDAAYLVTPYAFVTLKDIRLWLPSLKRQRGKRAELD